MEQLNRPTEQVWDARQKWFMTVEQEAEDPAAGAFDVGEQACALTADIEAAFCAGAWTTVVIAAMAVIDANLQEAVVPGFEGSAKQLLDAAGCRPAFHELRQFRNRLVHADPEVPAVTVDDQWHNRDVLEQHTRKAVMLMFEALYMAPFL